MKGHRALQYISTSAPLAVVYRVHEAGDTVGLVPSAL
jgi:hypothetical protein